MRIERQASRRSTNRLYAAVIVLFGATYATDCSAKKKEPLPKPPEPVSALDLEAMQTKIVPGDRNSVIEALTSVLSKEGWLVEASETDPGAIRAKSLRTQEGVGPQNDWILKYDEATRIRLLTKPERRFYRLRSWTRWLELSAKIEPWNGDSVRVTMTMVKVGAPPNAMHMDAQMYSGWFSVSGNMTTVQVNNSLVGTVLDDPAQYTRIYERLDRELATRRVIDASR